MPHLSRRFPLFLWALSLTLALGALGFGVLGAGVSYIEAQTTDEEIDYLSLAARLMKDGHYDRAELTLREVDEGAEGVDLPRLHTLRGLVSLKLQRYADARDAFLKATGSGEVDKSLFLHLAQAQYELKDYAATLDALKQAGEAATALPGAFLIRAQCHWALRQPEQALNVLSEAQRHFPDEPDFPRRRFFFLVDLGLFQEALELGQGFVERVSATEDDYAAVGEALRQAREFTKAEHVLEAARLRFPYNERLTLLLAHTYLGHERTLAAALLFEEASYLNGVHALEAAELYRRAKRLDRALSLNARVLDQAAKLKQRMSILLQMERFAMVVGMAPGLSRLGLLEEDDIRYALAYASFKLGDFEATEQALKQITSAELFGSANELRKMMQTCKEAGWQCM